LNLTCNAVYQNLSNSITKVLAESLINTFANNLGVSASRLNVTQINCTATHQVSVQLTISSSSGSSNSRRRRADLTNNNLQPSALAALLLQYINENKALNGSNFTLASNSSASYTFAYLPVQLSSSNQPSCEAASTTFTSKDNSELSAVLALVVILLVFVVVFMIVMCITFQRQLRDSNQQLAEVREMLALNVGRVSGKNGTVSPQKSTHKSAVKVSSLGSRLLADSYIDVVQDDNEATEMVPARTSYIEIEESAI